MKYWRGVTGNGGTAGALYSSTRRAICALVAAILVSVAGCSGLPGRDSGPSTVEADSLQELGVRSLGPSSLIGEPEDWSAAVRDWIEELHAAGAAPSLAIGVGRGGDPIFMHAVGLADVAREKAATTTTPYQIASLTKLFTAYALMALVDAGAISLDDPVQRWLPEGVTIGGDPRRSAAVTLRHLATHRSGLGDLEFNVHKGAPEEGGSYATVAPELVFEALTRTTLLFEPGSSFQYSNLGYGLLGLVLERVTDRSFDEVLGHHVVEPLELGNTWLIDTDHPEWDSVARRQDGSRDRGEASRAFASACPRQVAW